MRKESKFVNLRKRKQASDEVKARDRNMKFRLESDRGSVKKVGLKVIVEVSKKK